MENSPLSYAVMCACTRPPPGTVKPGNSREVPCKQGLSLAICSVSQKVRHAVFIRRVQVRFLYGVWFGSWLSLRLFGWSNYHSGYSVRNLSVYNEVFRTLPFMFLWCKGKHTFLPSR